jgi:uncharacterized protein with HEPN domain
MRPEIAKFLQDMLDAARAIRSYTDPRTREQYLADKAIRDACNWNFCVIGEALSQLRKVDAGTAEQISDSAKIIGLRNQLIHGYAVISDRITWDIIREKLPTLIREVEALLES